ncbi:MAG: endonuclease/exonuclease/phosphatase family protein [Nannocystaceae bacterium]
MTRARLLARVRPIAALVALAGCSGGGSTSDTAASASDADTEASTSGEATESSTETSTGTDAGTDTDTDSDSGTTGEPPAPLGPYRVMTFNLMCADCKPEGFEDWEARIPYLGDTMRRHDPDLLGVQELFNAEQVGVIEEQLEGEYTSVWFMAPDERSLDYADAAIFYRTSLFEEVEHGFYWLSPTPDVPYSSGFSTPQLPRLLVWARLRALADQREFYFATTHFDNNSPSQQMSAPLVLERTVSLADALPLILTGDFNSRPDSTAYGILTEGVDGQGRRVDDAFVLAGAWASDTNLEPPPGYDPSVRIDHLFVAGGPWQASEWVVDQWGYGPTMHATSDHFAIQATLAIP